MSNSKPSRSSSRVPRRKRNSEPGASPIADVPLADADVQLSEQADQPGLLLVISGPSGVGKDTVWREAQPCLTSFARTITCTTRPQRPTEEEGVSYFFVTDEQFDELIEEDELLEWAQVHGYRYGVPAALVLQRLEQGLDVVCVIDPHGAKRVRSLFMSSALLIFIKPPAGEEPNSADILKERIKARGGASQEEVAIRVGTAVWEMTQSGLYDHELINDDVQRVAKELCDVVQREKARRAGNANSAA